MLTDENSVSATNVPDDDAVNRHALSTAVNVPVEVNVFTTVDTDVPAEGVPLVNTPATRCNPLVVISLVQVVSVYAGVAESVVNAIQFAYAVFDGVVPNVWSCRNPIPLFVILFWVL